MSDEKERWTAKRIKLALAVADAAIKSAIALCSGGIAIAFRREIVIAIVAVCAGMSCADVARTIKDCEKR